MIRAQYGFRNRNPIRAVLFISALACFSLNVSAAKLSGWGSAGYTQGGKSWTLNPGGGDLRVPITNPGGGWQTAGNYGIQNGATGETFNLGYKGEVFKYMPDGSYVKYPFQGTSAGGLKLGDIAGAIGGIVGGPLGIACAIGCPYLKDWISPPGFRIDPDGKEGLQKNEPRDAQYRCQYGSAIDVGLTPRACAQNAANKAGMGQPTYEVRNRSPTMSIDGWHLVMSANPDAGGVGDISVSVLQSGQPDWIPASMDDIAPYMKTNRPDPRIIDELLRKGADIPLPTTTTVTGPSNIIGPSKSTVNADGTRTVESTRYNFSTSGATINNTTNVTTTTIYNTDNSIRSTSTVTQTPVDSVTPDKPPVKPTEETEEEKDQCESNPDRISCSELDTPEGEIPRTQKDITFAPEDVLGAGSCPADVTASFQSAPGLSGVKLLNWQGFCDAALPLRAIIIAMASIMAFFIVMPGGRVE